MLGAVVLWAAGARAEERPPVDTEAMHEAMSPGADEHYASSRAYFYYLRAMMRANANDHRAAIDDLRQAEIYDPESAPVRVALAEQLERLGDLAKAEEELRKAASRNPRHEPTLFALGRVLAEEKKQAKAIPWLQKALKLNPRDALAAIALAQAHLDLGQVDQALRGIDALAKAAPEEAAGYKFLGQALAERGDTKRAERALRQARQRAPGDVETLQLLAKLYEDTGRLSDAAQAYEDALGSDPEEPNVLLAAGALALRRADPATAKAYFDTLLGVMPDDVDVKVKIAFAWFGAHRLHESGQLLDDARKSLPDDARLAFYAGLIHEDEHAYDAAGEAFSAVDKSAELYPEARLHLAICLSQAGHHDAAIADLQQDLAEHPGARTYLVALADAYARAGKLQQGLDLLQHEADAKSADDLYGALAELYARYKRHTDAVAMLQTALASHPNHGRLLYALALAYSKAGEPQKAISTMRQLLTLEPDNANAMNFVAYSLAELGADLDEAERMVKKALALRPDSGAFTDSLGWVLYKRGLYRQAVEALQHAEALTPNEPVIIEHLADALTKASRRTDATDAYRRALNLLDQEPDPSERDQIERKLRAISVQQAGN